MAEVIFFLLLHCTKCTKYHLITLRDHAPQPYAVHDMVTLDLECPWHESLSSNLQLDDIIGADFDFRCTV